MMYQITTTRHGTLVHHPEVNIQLAQAREESAITSLVITSRMKLPLLRKAAANIMENRGDLESFIVTANLLLYTRPR